MTATSAGSAYVAIAQSITNGQCAADFPVNVITSLRFRIEVATTATGDVWKIGQCDAGSTATCTISAPLCTYTQTSGWQNGSMMGGNGDLDCTVGGAANPLSGGKTGKFRAEVNSMRGDDHGFSGNFLVSENAGCVAVNSFVVKRGAWIKSCAFSGDAFFCTK
ncbi:MAG: hypothetical protein HY777_08530 [Betaproteobacteria bacterium]|nr:hypothetical protein [Betaproteobacteria bacterium]